MSKKIFHLVSFDSKNGSMEFTVQLLLEARTVEKAAAVLGCDLIPTPCLPGRIVLSMIDLAEKGDCRNFQLLSGRPSIFTLVRTSIDQIEGELLLKIKGSTRLFLAEFTPPAA
jgi:hypothetical protein